MTNQQETEPATFSAWIEIDGIGYIQDAPQWVRSLLRLPEHPPASRGTVTDPLHGLSYPVFKR
jgi:hypothetical protein